LAGEDTGQGKVEDFARILSTFPGSESNCIQTIMLWFVSHEPPYLSYFLPGRYILRPLYKET